ncbi:MAG: DUF5320 domain-containing protein [Nanoarchaeota archaeon]|nr:DUF5320 domain-containing protein [Nanoarchaeota archaeon]
MPGYNRTGPEGRGPMTGRGAGYCASGSGQPPTYQEGQEIVYGIGRGGVPRGGGGRGRGSGRGMGRGAGRNPVGLSGQGYGGANAAQSADRQGRMLDPVLSRLEKLVAKLAPKKE